MCAEDPDLPLFWGCTAPSVPHNKGEEPFVYDLGGVLVNRCPIALTRLPFARSALQLYGAYKHGITPNGRGWRYESPLYREVMVYLECLEAEASDWYLKERKAHGNRDSQN